MGQYVERTEALFIEPETVSVEAGATTDTSQHILTENAESLLTQMIFEWPLGQNHRLAKSSACISRFSVSG